ncbi:MAG TPA: TetR/AcrR family transcriptional regulator [Streptosporangiaceae bacterium]
MGNREDLIAGAKRCLLDKGYAATTARDIAAASGVSLAAIGYHFGSKEALMNQAVYDSVGDWAEELQRAVAAGTPPGASQREKFEAAIGHTLESFGGPSRGLWAAQLELVGLAQRHEQLREFLAGVQEFAGQGLAEMFAGIDSQAGSAESRGAGYVMHALFIGLLAKFMLDQDQAPAAGELTDGLRAIAGRLG